MAESFGDTFDHMSMDTWSTKRTSSHGTGDISMTDFMYPPTSFANPTDAWNSSSTQYDQDASRFWEGNQPRRDRKARQVIVTLRDDQLGQLIEAISPPKKARDRDTSSQRSDHGHGQSVQTGLQPPPPRMAGMPLTTRPSAASLARKQSYPEFNPHLRNVPSKASPDKGAPSELAHKSPAMYHASFTSDKENRPPSQQDSRLPTPYPIANRVPTPHPFVPQLGRWDSDASMRDPSSVFSSLSRFEQLQQARPEGKSSPIPGPSAGGSIRSRKEGLGVNSPAPAAAVPPHHDIRHDKSLLPALDTTTTTTAKQHDKVPHNTPITTSPHTRIEDIINPNPHSASDNGSRSFLPSHKSGMSSIDSTGRLERQLFSALGEELNSFADNLDAPSGLVESAALPGLEELDAPLVKRKRQGTFGAERGRSPMAKMVREERGGEVVVQGAEMPHLRGD